MLIYTFLLKRTIIKPLNFFLLISIWFCYFLYSIGQNSEKKKSSNVKNLHEELIQNNDNNFLLYYLEHAFIKDRL